MFCPNCGSELQRGSTLCSKCNIAFKDDAEECDDTASDAIRVQTINTTDFTAQSDSNSTAYTESLIVLKPPLSPMKFSLIYLAIAFSVILALFILMLLSALIVGDGVLFRFFLGAATVCVMLLPLAIIILIIRVIWMRKKLYPSANSPHVSRMQTKNQEEKDFLKQQKKAAKQELKAAEAKVKNEEKAYKDKVAALQKEYSKHER